MRILILLYLIMICSLISCSGNDKGDINGNNLNDRTKIDSNLIDKTIKISEVFESEGQYFKFRTDDDIIINGDKGTKIHIFKNTFVHPYSSHLTLKLIECYSIPEMMFNNLTTINTDGKCLVTDGMIFIEVSDSAGNLYEPENGKVKIEMLTQSADKNMKLFYGIKDKEVIKWDESNTPINIKPRKTIVIDEDENSSDSIIQIVEELKILPTDSTLGEESKIQNTKIIIDEGIKNENLATYIFQIKQLGWINCDKYIEGETHDLEVEIDKIQGVNLKVYLILNEKNSIFANSVKSMESVIFQNVPNQEPCTLVGIAATGDKIKFGYKKCNTNLTHIELNELTTMERQEVIDELYSLFGTDIWNRPSPRF